MSQKSILFITIATTILVALIFAFIIEPNLNNFTFPYRKYSGVLFLIAGSVAVREIGISLFPGKDDKKNKGLIVEEITLHLDGPSS